jgi:hypothetical protein
MRLMKLAVAAVCAFAFNSAYAQNFHFGGVAACDGCHVMHNASGGAATLGKKGPFGSGYGVTKNNPGSNTGNSYLLQGVDQSSTCLLCHAGSRTAGSQYTIANLGADGAGGTAAGVNFTPGGDFGWLFSAGKQDRHGHNVVAADFGLGKDDLITAPGGSFASGAGKAQFACSNCHDPHGRFRQVVGGTIAGPSAVGVKIDPIAQSGSYGAAPASAAAVGVYRLLGGKGYAPASNPAFPFPNDPPIAVAPSTYNQPEAGAGSPGEVRVAYGTGMSEWCQNCHTNIHLDGYVTGAPGLRHPAGSNAKLRQTQADIYNSYIASGDLSNPVAKGYYTSLVPFEVGAANVNGVASNAGDPNFTPAAMVASTNSNVMCLSCHRAHASGFDSITRWDMSATFISDGTAFSAQQAAAYYGRTATSFKTFQRSLCNKCHAKD